MTTEKKLLQFARSFDQQVLVEIYDRYSPGIYRYAIRLSGDDSQAEECVAETFSRFLQALQRGGGPKEHLQAYLYRIAHNWITDHYRAQSTIPLNTDNEVEGDQVVDPSLCDRDVFLRERVRSALMALTPDQRKVVVLKFLEGWSNEEVAKAMKKPVGAVKSLQHRALAALNRSLTPFYE